MGRFAILAGFVIFFLIPPAALAQLELSPGIGPINFSGSITSMSCTSGWTDLNLWLKEPAGAHLPIDSFTKNLSVQVANCMNPWQCVYSYTFTFNGSLQTDPDWPTGDYQIIAAAPFDCSSLYGFPYAWRGTKTEATAFQVNASNPYPTADWNWSAGSDPGWNQAGFNDSSWSTDTPASWKGLTWTCTSTDGYGRCLPWAWSITGSPDAWFRKTFWLDQLEQTDLLLDVNQFTECWVNGHYLGTASGRLDLTPYLKPGENLLACHARAQYEHSVRDLPGSWIGTWYSVPEVGCQIHCWESWLGGECHTFTCSNPSTKCTRYIHQDGYYRWACYTLTKPRFNARLALHRPDDLLWSNDNSSWHYNQRPILSDSWYLEKPDHYNPDGTIYTGIRPWSGPRLYLKKWFFPNFAQGTLLLSSTTKPTCYLNEQALILEETEDDWWVYQTEVSLDPDKPNLLSCTSPRSDYYNLFDLDLKPQTAVWASPFEPGSGNKGDQTGPLPSHPAGSSLPAAPLAAALISVGAVGTTRLVNRRRPGSPNFWKKVSLLRTRYQTRLARIEKENREWKKWQAQVKIWHRERIKKLELARIQTFLAGLTGTFGERLARIRSWRLSQHITSRASVDLLNNTTSFYSNLALLEVRVRELRPEPQPRPQIKLDLQTIAANQLLFQENLARMRETRSTALWVRPGQVTLAEEINGALLGWSKALIKNNVLREGDDPRLTFGAALSIAGAVKQDIGEPVILAGAGCMVAGGGLTLTGAGAPLGGSIFAAGSKISIAGLIVYTMGGSLKTLGDSLQGWACADMKDVECVKRAKRKAEWNMLDAALELVSVKLPNLLKSKVPDRALKALENFLDKIGLRKFEDEMFGGIISISTDVVKEPFKGLDMDYDPHED